MAITYYGYLSEGYLAHTTYGYLAGRAENAIGMQVDMITDGSEEIGVQTEMKIVDSTDDEFIGMQAGMVAAGTDVVGSQASMIIAKDKATGSQAEMKIVDATDDEFIGMQVEMVIKDDEAIGMQANMARAIAVSCQVNGVLYNVTQLRILCDFISRGTPALGGNNWTSMQSMAADDLGDLSNLNNDLIEHRAQTANGVTAIWEIRCDTGITNAFVDTLAILGHNFTKGARVTFQASNSASWTSVDESVVLTTELDNMYWIKPTPASSAYRYRRLIIEDSANADNHLYIGCIVFGLANILSPTAEFDNPATFGRRHFKDTLETEGFTSVSNDRATRKILGLRWSELNRFGTNYRILENYMLSAKTDLKCLIIPRPTRPSALAVFSKLVDLPEESHNSDSVEDDNWHVTLELNWDESK